MVYSKFSSAVTDFENFARSLWVGFFGLVMIFIYKHESEVGFSDALTPTIVLILITVSVYFALNYLSGGHEGIAKFFTFIVCVDIVYKTYLLFISFDNYQYFSASVGAMVFYAIVTLISLLRRKKKVENNPLV